MLRGGGGAALYGITKTMGPYGEQKDLPLGLFSAQQTARRIMRGSGHFEVTVFSITTDKKRESNFIPI